MPKIPNRVTGVDWSEDYLRSHTGYVGIDPGTSSGGIAMLIGGIGCRPSTETILHKMPETERDIWDLINRLVESLDTIAGAPKKTRIIFYLERVGGFIKGNPAPGSAMFGFGENFGLLKMALCAANVRYELIRPQDWQKGLKIPSRDKKKYPRQDQWKKFLRGRAQQLFPGVEIKKETADAILLAEYCRRKETGKL